jgi:membrane-bound metal-dependent hydrolase YbcI (DUF457 family)
MFWKGHITFGWLWFGLVCWPLVSAGLVTLGSEPFLWAVGAAAVGAVIPDIDEPRSLIGGVPGALFGLWMIGFVGLHIVPMALFGADSILVRLVDLWVYVGIGAGVFAVGVISRAINQIWGHRGPTHSLVVALFFGVVGIVLVYLELVWWIVVVGAMAGWLSHLMGDILWSRANRTGGGVQLAWPLNDRVYG